MTSACKKAFDYYLCGLIIYAANTIKTGAEFYFFSIPEEVMQA
jgi:hypothetical protein